MKVFLQLFIFVLTFSEQNISESADEVFELNNFSDDDEAQGEIVESQNDEAEIRGICATIAFFTYLLIHKETLTKKSKRKFMNKSLKLKKKWKWKTVSLLKRAKTTEKEEKKVSKLFIFCYTHAHFY